MAAVMKETSRATSRLRGFNSGAREIDDAPVEVSAGLPAWLRGTLLLNGPALWDWPGGSYRHWFDGMAMLHRVRIDADAAVRYRSRFVQSKDYQASKAAGAPAFGGFDTPDPAGFFERMKNLRHPRATDNPAVVMSRIGDRWIANTETETLTRFDPDTLETLGAIDFEDNLQMPLLSAHGITDRRGDYWNVGIELGPKCTYRLYRIRAGTQRREVVGSITVAKSGYLHAFAMSTRHAIVWETAMRAQPLGFLFTGNAYIRNFRWDPGSGSMLHAIALDDGRVTSWAIPAMNCFHAVQAYETDDGFVVELADYDDAAVFDDLLLANLRAATPMKSVPRLSRYRLRRGRSDAQREPVGEAIELMQIHPLRFAAERASLTWGSGIAVAPQRRFGDRTVRIDLDSGERREWQRENAVHLEPLFVARPGGIEEDDGVLLVPTLADGDATTQLAVVDAKAMQCVATLAMPQVVPFGFHAAFMPA